LNHFGFIAGLDPAIHQFEDRFSGDAPLVGRDHACCGFAWRNERRFG
jgi:hypothetical protein